MRAILLLTADRRQPAVDALASGACALLLRLAPADAPTREEARVQARRFVEAARGSPSRPRLFVQIPAVRDEALDADLAAFAIEGVDGFFLEGCEGRADVQRLSAKLAVREAEAGLKAGAFRIVAFAAQTPAGVFALGAYAGASARLAGLAMDDGPLPGGATARAAARALLALGAAAAGVPAFDLAPVSRGAAFETACRAIRRDGFSGLLTPAAADIDAIRRAFPGP